MKVLFLCTANSCRSQMAESWARCLLPPGGEAASAGLLVHPIDARTRWVMAEAGCDMEGQRSKAIEEVDLDAFDLVVTLSEEAARFLPALADPARHLHLPVPDPMAATGPAAEVLDAFRAARDHIREIVAAIARGETPGGDR